MENCSTSSSIVTFRAICVSDWDISPECCLVSLGRLGDEFYF